MNDQSILDALRESGFLQDVSEEDLSRLAAIARPLSFDEGDILLREGQMADDVYVILSGTVSLEICAPGVGCRRIMTLGEGDLLSWSSVLEQSRLTATARAVSPVEVAAINGRQLLALCEHDPEFGYAFMRRVTVAIAHRLSATRMQLLDVFGTEMPEVPDARED